ncbi:MAG: translocation/assembly module TamB domain-containing protein [Nitrospirota bacterium]
MKDSIGEPQGRRRLVKVLYLLFFTIVVGLVIFVSRGPHVSNVLKRLILPELEAAFRQRVIAQKIYINIFPFFVEAKGMKVFDEDGKRIFFANRVKGYVEPLGLLSKRISIRRLVIKEPDISTDKEQIGEVIRSFKAYLKEERRLPFKVRIKAAEINEGSASLRDEDLKSLIGIKGLGGEVIFGRDPRLKMSIKNFGIRREGLPELTGDINASLVFRKDEVEIKRFNIGSYGSVLQSSGFYSKGKGSLRTEIALLVDSVKRIFNLKERGEGRISARGEIRLEGLQQWKDIFVDLKLKGDFYIQTLMEMLKVNPVGIHSYGVKERVEGLVDFHGEIKGRLFDISAVAKARLRKGNLFGVEVDSLRCDVIYQDGLMRFKNGNAELYSGNAKAEASINLPGVEPFTLNVKFNSIDSSAAIMLIGWEPEIPAGKVDGELVTSGGGFNPDGWFVYNAQSTPFLTLPPRGGGEGWGEDSRLSKDNVLDRIRNIKGSYSLRGDILSLFNLQVRTSLSDLQTEGTIDITKKTLNLKGRLNTNEVSDLILPYYAGLKGQGNFSGGITGTFDNPDISGRIDILNAFVEGYRAYRITSHFSYNKNLLNVHELLLTPPEEEHRIKGRILFPEAEKPFDFSEPVYEMNATIKNADLREVIKILYRDLSTKGRLNADFRIGGKGEDIEITGNAHIEKAEVYKIPFDSASMAFSYLDKGLSFKKAIIRRGISTLAAEGKISSDEKFYFRASSERILIKDIGLGNIPEGAFLSIKSEGHGTFEDPTITLNAEMVGGVFKGRSLGSGIIDVAVKNKNILLNASLFDEKVKLTGKGNLNDKLPWTAEADIQPGKYDFILGSILKDVPEDLLLNLKGHVGMKGDRKNITAEAVINHLTLALFDYSFSNDSDIKVQINNRRISFPAFTIRSGGTSLFKLRGGVEIGREYNLLLEGSSSLSPLKGLSKGVEHLTGESNFVFSITGKWEKPEMNGGLSISNASFGLRGYYPRISSINGYASIDKDRIVVKKLSGKVGGGDINISGLLYLKAFDIKRFYFEADLDNITASLSKDFGINFKGNLLYKGTPDAQRISGDIGINRSKYKKRVEWKRWLLMTKAKERPRAKVSRFERTELNIRISGSDNIYIDNNIARAPVMVDTVLRGTISRPVLFGRLESKKGDVYFRNNEFRIIHASADFADPNRLNPVIEIAAETSIKGYNIKLNLEGQMEHFNLSLSSDPPLEEMDILALLTVGQVGKQLKGLEGGIGAGEATSFLTGRLQDVFEERLKTITGLDRLQIDPYISKTTGTAGPRVTVSKRLAGDRLFVTYTSSLGSAEEQILKLEYLLDRNISLIGIRDERGSAGGDIKFRFKFK